MQTQIRLLSEQSLLFLAFILHLLDVLLPYEVFIKLDLHLFSMLPLKSYHTRIFITESKFRKQQKQRPISAGLRKSRDRSQGNRDKNDDKLYNLVEHRLPRKGIQELLQG